MSMLIAAKQLLVRGYGGTKTTKVTRSVVRRTLSTFSQYEYPTRTEAPTISSQKAKDVIAEEPRKASKLRLQDDPFDDSCSLSDDEVDMIRKEQQEKLSSTSLNSLPITSEVPSFVPPNVPSQELETPKTEITTLDNGLRVVSQETYGQMCTVGVLTNAGSRHEAQEGVVHLLESLAFSSTQDYPSGVAINELLQDWGATRFVSLAREQSLHCIDVLRPNVSNAVHMLSQVVLEPLILEEEVDYAKLTLEFQAMDMIPELTLGEALQVAAYGKDQQLGRLHFCSVDAVHQLSADAARQFWMQNIRYNPKGMVLAGAGIGHDELVDLANKYFGHLEQKSSPVTVPSVYRGGSYQIPKPELDQYCRVALGFEVGGWHSTDMVTACVLQTLLGGGSSFSAGGPGKGMYSRMYQHVLNRYSWMETAEAFTSFADESGLLGVSASTEYPNKVTDLVTVLADQVARLAIQPVSDEELDRARNMLKCNVLTQLESRLILFEDMGRQILTYGTREDAKTTCAKIEAVTKDDIQKLAQRMIQQQSPTLASTGSHLEKLPTHDTVASWFRGIS